MCNNLFVHITTLPNGINVIGPLFSRDSLGKAYVYTKLY